jgi:cellulase
MTCYQLTVTGSGTLEPKGVTFPAAYTATGPGLGFSIHADLDSYPAPGPALIEGGTEATPSLLTFGTLSGAPAAAPAASATGAASKAPASTAASGAASSTAAVKASSAAAVSSAVASSAAVEATSAAPVATSVAVETPSSSVAAPVAAGSSVAPSPIANSASSALPGTASPIKGISSAAPSVVPTTMVTAVRPTQTAEASGPIKEYYQCGGQGFKGVAKCADGLVCKDWNSWYSQCVQPDQTSQLVSSKGPMPTTVASAPRPTATYVAAEPSAEAPKPTSAAVEPTVVTPAATDAPAAGEKTYTLETFIAFLEKEAGSESAAKIRRMIEALQ